MTNNDELWMKLEASESDELALNGNEVSNQLRHLADNEIDSDSFAVVIENYNGREVDFERPITELAFEAAELVDALLAERDADKKRIEMLEKYVDERDAQNQELLLNIGSLQQRIAELVESHKQLREAMAIIHNTIRMDGAYTPLAAIMSRAKRAYEESAVAAGIKLDVGE